MVYIRINIFIVLLCFVNSSLGEIAWKKCEEYANKLLQIPAPAMNHQENGEDANPRELPFTALIGYGKGILAYWLCGGTLVSPRYVLSAARCAEDKRIGPARMAWLGDLELGTMQDDATTNIIDIEKIIKHPKYKEGSREHDIALFELQFDFMPTLYINPACFHQSEATEVIAPGWGANGDAFLKTMMLKIGDGKVIPNTSCNEVYSHNPLLPGGVTNGLCVVAAPPSRDMCHSDTGGGLLSSMKVAGYNMWTLRGINTLSKDCTSAPVYYTDIDHYIPWIESIVWASSDSP